MLRKCPECTNCSKNVSVSNSIYFWVCCNNCFTQNLAYCLVLLLYLDLPCSRLKNKGNLLPLLIYKFRGRVSAVRVLLELCFLSFAFLSAALFFRLASLRATRRQPAAVWTLCFLIHVHGERKYHFPWPSNQSSRLCSDWIITETIIVGKESRCSGVVVTPQKIRPHPNSLNLWPYLEKGSLLM